MPKPANRLIEPRSVVARDSSCPDCHSSWKAGLEPLQVLRTGRP